MLVDAPLRRLNQGLKAEEQKRSKRRKLADHREGTVLDTHPRWSLSVLMRDLMEKESCPFL